MATGEQRSRSARRRATKGTCTENRKVGGSTPPLATCYGSARGPHLRLLRKTDRDSSSETIRPGALLTVAHSQLAESLSTAIAKAPRRTCLRRSRATTWSRRDRLLDAREDMNSVTGSAGSVALLACSSGDTRQPLLGTAPCWSTQNSPFQCGTRHQSRTRGSLFGIRIRGDYIASQSSWSSPSCGNRSSATSSI
jgi:hypothetical protein